MKPLRCSFRELIEATLRAALLRYGCASGEVRDLQIKEGPAHGAEVALASVCCPDGRELFRVYCIEDLDYLLASPALCRSLASTIRRLAGYNVDVPAAP